MATIETTPAPAKTIGRTTAILIALAALLIGGGLGYAGGTYNKWWGWTSTEVLKEGTGKVADGSHAILIELEGKMSDGKVFAPKEGFAIPVTFEELGQADMDDLVTEIKKMKEGGHYKVTLPSRVLNKDGTQRVPEGTSMIFDIKLIKVLDKAGYEAEAQSLMQRQMQQMGISPNSLPGAEAGPAPEGAQDAPAPAPEGEKKAEPAKR